MKCISWSFPRLTRVFFFRCRSLIGLGSGSDHRAMLLLASVFAALAIAAAAASDDPSGFDKRADGYAMVWRKGKRSSGAADASPLYGGRYVLSAPRGPPIR